MSSAGSWALIFSSCRAVGLPGCRAANRKLMKITQFSRWKSVSPQIHGAEFVEHLPDAKIQSRCVAEWQSSADMQPDLAWLSVLFRVGFVLFFLAKSGFARIQPPLLPPCICI